ncbi:MAG: hypothetical protein QGF00_34250, partial [Planctomycetota bacterium]|nr:hypothetical protein [Planctomycetota bacterium]
DARPYSVGISDCCVFEEIQSIWEIPADYRDHMEVALGKVRDLLGEVWAQRPMSLFSGWLRVMDPQVHVALRMLGGS